MPEGEGRTVLLLSGPGELSSRENERRRTAVEKPLTGLRASQSTVNRTKWQVIRGGRPTDLNSDGSSEQRASALDSGGAAIAERSDNRGQPP